MPKITPLALAIAFTFTSLSTVSARPLGSFETVRNQNFTGFTTYVVRRSPPKAQYSSAISSRMIAAASIAEKSAERRSTKKCWRYVKRALLQAHAVSSYPQTVYAKQAARELTRDFGFRRLPVRSPFNAPIGSVLVYGGSGAGHVEIRTAKGYVSDYRSQHPCSLPFIGAYAKTK